MASKHSRLDKVSFNLPMKWFSRPEGFSLDGLAPEIPPVKDLMRFVENCIDVAVQYEKWRTENHGKAIGKLDMVFAENLADLVKRLSDNADELVRFEYYEGVVGLDDYQRARFNDLMIETLVLCMRFRRFIGGASAGRFALWLFENGYLRKPELSDSIAEEDALAEKMFYTGRDTTRHTQVYKNFMSRKAKLHGRKSLRESQEAP